MVPTYTERYRQVALARHAELMNWNGPHSQAVSRFEAQHADDEDLVSLMRTAKALKLALCGDRRS